MTEDEARTKWCPMVRYEGADGAAANRFELGSNPKPEWGTSNNPSICRCIASDCMMWVSTDNECEPMDIDYIKKTSAINEPKCYPAGYCGLADRNR